MDLTVEHATRFAVPCTWAASPGDSVPASLTIARWWGAWAVELRRTMPRRTVATLRDGRWIERPGTLPTTYPTAQTALAAALATTQVTPPGRPAHPSLFTEQEAS